ncbi:MAG: hypothetical protein B6D55_04520 [Candidatus Omnitrophica bacterium 4484_70.2]|nr:MAG: hypothetical protein B6D55_04520 [Candidatus Omnitrophica bacterium 4484_70.2]
MNSKTKILIGVLIGIVLMGGILVFLFGESLEREPEIPLVKNETTIFLWNQGKRIVLNQNTFAKEIQEKCEKIFENADSAYKLVVKESLIKKLREKEVSIEIIYNSPKIFELRGFPKKIQLQILRLLIPLTGRFSHPVTIFYGTPEDKLPDGTLLEYGEFNDLINNHAEREINYIKQILKENFKIEFKEPQVIIKTDKTEYEQGEIIIITIKNNLDKTIVFKTDCFPEYGSLGLWEIERKEKERWKKVKMLLPLEGECLPGYFGIAPCIEKMKPQSEFHQEWNQKICLFNGNGSLFSEKPILLQEGTYRLVFTYSDKFRKDEYTLTGIEIINPRKIYSNEFIIKERCAKAGELINYPPGTNRYLPDVCCEGLKPLAGFVVNEKGECERVKGGPFLTCMSCGNGICETINNFDENKCNCPEDCGVTIKTDKEEYEQGERVKVTITNNLKEPIKLFNWPFVFFERFEDGEWVRIKDLIDRCPSDPLIKIPAFKIVEDKFEHDWGAKIKVRCENNKSVFENVPPGKYRAFVLFKRNQSEEQETIYSNEFIIKEKSEEY